MSPKNSLIKFIELPKILDECELIVAQTPEHIPFKIKRVYFIRRAHPQLPRGFHAHKTCQQIIFCICGSIKLIIDNGKVREKIILAEPHKGIFLDKMVWHEMVNFKKNTILLVLASDNFNEKDYIRDYEKFRKRAAEIS